MACHSHPHRQGHLVELDCHATLKETFPSKFFITLLCFNLSSITPNPVVRMKHVLSSVIKAIQTIVWRKVAMSNITHSQFYLTLKTQYINFWLNMYCLQRWRYKSPKNFQRACPSPAMRSRTRNPSYSTIIHEYNISCRRHLGFKFKPIPSVHSPLQKREGTGTSFLYRLDWKSKH